MVGGAGLLAAAKVQLSSPLRAVAKRPKVLKDAIERAGY